MLTPKQQDDFLMKRFGKHGFTTNGDNADLPGTLHAMKKDVIKKIIHPAENVRCGLKKERGKGEKRKGKKI